MNKTELLKHYTAHLKPKSQYAKYVEDYLSETDTLDKDSVLAYRKRLGRRGRGPGTVDLCTRIVRAFFRASEVPWPFHRGELLGVNEQEEHRPALAVSIVTRMIEAARAGKLLLDCVPFLALSTTYGLRRGEMVVIEPDDVKGNLIFIHTLKGGRQRWHQIPPEIQPYIEEHDWSHRYSLGRMSWMFRDVVNGTGGLGALKKFRLGWHSIRRPLLSGLLDNGCKVLVAKRFLRWGSSTGEDAMPARYYANQEIDIEGEVVVSREAESDVEIMEKYHPYLKLWREGG